MPKKASLKNNFCSFSAFCGSKVRIWTTSDVLILCTEVYQPVAWKTTPGPLGVKWRCSLNVYISNIKLNNRFVFLIKGENNMHQEICDYICIFQVYKVVLKLKKERATTKGSWIGRWRTPRSSPVTLPAEWKLTKNTHQNAPWKIVQVSCLMHWSYFKAKSTSGVRDNQDGAWMWQCEIVLHSRMDFDNS